MFEDVRDEPVKLFFLKLVSKEKNFLNKKSYLQAVFDILSVERKQRNASDCYCGDSDVIHIKLAVVVNACPFVVDEGQG